MVTITRSTIVSNIGAGPGALLNIEGTFTITDSAIVGNGGDPYAGVGLGNVRGALTIVNSTITRNFGGVVAGILNGGQLLIVSSTIADNFRTGQLGEEGGGIVTQGAGTTVLQNTILARNGARPDCRGPVTSLGSNLIGDPTGCTITLHASDLTGAPGFGAFIDDGTPGHGHLPLLPTSQAINAGNNDACPAQDQVGQPRVGRCDIGAVEFSSAIPTPPVPLISTVAGDSNGDGVQDLAGRDGNYQVWQCVASQPQCTFLGGWLFLMVAGDVDGDGTDDLAGLGWGYGIWTMIHGQWQQLPGLLHQLVIGDFYGDGKQHLAGLWGNTIWREPRLGWWEYLPGYLTSIVAGDFNDDGVDDLAGLSVGSTVYAHAGGQWYWLPGFLPTLQTEPQADGTAALVGSLGTCWYRMATFGTWQVLRC
jgi:hypothetical protein